MRNDNASCVDSPLEHTWYYPNGIRSGNAPAPDVVTRPVATVESGLPSERVPGSVLPLSIAHKLGHEPMVCRLTGWCTKH